jgi:hypothetical protein
MLKTVDRLVVRDEEFPSNVLPRRRVAQETGAVVTTATPADRDWTAATWPASTTAPASRRSRTVCDTPSERSRFLIREIAGTCEPACDWRTRFGGAESVCRRSYIRSHECAGSSRMPASNSSAKGKRSSGLPMSSFGVQAWEYRRPPLSPRVRSHLHNVLLRAPHDRDQLFLLLGRHLELIESLTEICRHRLPLGFVDGKIR